MCFKIIAEKSPENQGFFSKFVAGSNLNRNLFRRRNSTSKGWSEELFVIGIEYKEVFQKLHRVKGC
jgi:hypothetical protein